MRCSEYRGATDARLGIAAAAQSLIRSPFIHQGRIPGEAIDCLGVVVCSAHACNFKLEDYKTYARNPDSRVLLQKLEERMVSISVEDAWIGDVLCFWVVREERPQHFGILSKEDESGRWMVHCPTDAGEVIEEHLGSGWQERIHSAWRFKELAEWFQ